MEFMDWTADALLSLSSDVRVKRELRAYALWELDYRLAFSVADAPDEVLEAYRARR